ncbi:hypothetical protein AAFC00_006728 [Neodothiora populina]|uniref:Ureidoglycolate hydrolase n=1 Tax=Neodothiora populina TaxID=2781224 RepID=A0ABR3PB02_9PEZI
MPPLPQIVAPNLRVSVQPLEPQAFAPFGTVIQNPEHASSKTDAGAYDVVSANQGSALKYLDVTHMANHYDVAPSGKPAKVVMNMFVCSPRQLDNVTAVQRSGLGSTNGASSAFSVRILERHPFTPQTFVPTGLCAADKSTQYLVIVAPTRQASPGSAGDTTLPYPPHRPVRRRSITSILSRSRGDQTSDSKDKLPVTGFPATGPQRPKGIEEPDLSQLKAFIADGSQSVTYGPGTWHAPMVVLGASSVDFVVVQYANGVALEDCQEVAVAPKSGAQGLQVIIDQFDLDQKWIEKARL